MAIGKDIVAARNLGRRTAQSIQAAAANNSTPGVQRTRGVVTAVHEDGRCDVELGSTAHSMLLESIATTVDCSDKAFVGSTVLVDTFDHISVIVGVIATGENKSTAETTAKEAADAASKAKTAADTAQQQADAAKIAADAAKSGAEDAKKLAETARDTASGASAAANKAQKAADSAAERIETVEGEIASVKEDAATTKSELEGKIQTVTDTMTADYAKKTDVEDVSTSLKSEISTSAAGIRAEVSSTYASKTEVGEAVGTLKDEVASTYVTQTNFNVLSDEVKSTVASVEEVKVDAQAAQKAANEATSAANTAKEKAEQATSDASTASETASAAKEAAAAAQAAADNARDAATTAGAEAVNAKTAADKANADLATAQANLEKLQTQADTTDADLTKAKADVATAKANADAANASAEAAATAAKEANDTATSASENAKAAKTAADEAATAATEAGESASKAKETAAAAQEKANKAAEDLAALESRVTTAETSIKQNAEAIELKASKTELEDGVADAKSYSDSQLAVKADEITASVETAQAGVDTLESLVRVYGEGVEVAKKVNGAYTSSKAVITDETFSIVAQDGTELASYGKDKVYLGKNSQKAEINLCNGRLQISASDDPATSITQTYIRPSGTWPLRIGKIWRYEEEADDTTSYATVTSVLDLYSEWNKAGTSTPGISLNTSAYGTVDSKALAGGTIYTGLGEVELRATRPQASTEANITLGATADKSTITIEADKVSLTKADIDASNVKTKTLTATETTTSTLTVNDKATVYSLAALTTITAGNKIATNSITNNGASLSITSTGAMTIKANNASSNVTLNNTVFGNNSVNTTTAAIDNLYWDSTLLGGRVGVKLWSGTLSKGGSITVSDLNRYRVLMVACNSIEEAGLMAVRSDSIYCTAGWAYDNGSASYVYKATFRKDSTSGTKLTLVSASRHTLTTNCPGELQNVVALWGLI